MKFKAEVKEDPDMDFCWQVASRLRRMTPSQNAVTKLRIQEVLYHIEYPVCRGSSDILDPTHNHPAYTFGPL